MSLTFLLIGLLLQSDGGRGKNFYELFAVFRFRFFCTREEDNILLSY